MAQREVMLRLRRPTAEQMAAAKVVLAIKEKAARAKLPRLAWAYARSTLALAKCPETMKVTIQALRIGDLEVCTIPFETFVEIDLELKKRSAFARTMVISIANGYHGYLPTPEEHKLGGYETWVGTCKVREDSSAGGGSNESPTSWAGWRLKSADFRIPCPASLAPLPSTPDELQLRRDCRRGIVKPQVAAKTGARTP